MQQEQIVKRLMNEYGDAVFRMCYLYLKDYHLAEDAAQETFMKAMRSYDQFHHEAEEKSWLIRIAINCCKNTMRTRWFRFGRNILEEGCLTEKEDPIERIAEADSIARAIGKLERKDREILLLYYYQELSMKEIARITGRSENAVIQRVNRARNRLKRILLEAGYER